MLAATVGLEWWWLVIATLIVFVGSATQASVGVGLGLLAAPTLTLIDTAFIPGALALGVVPLTVGMAIRERHHIDPEVYRAAVWRVGGVVIGAWTVATVSDSWVALVIGLSVLGAVIGSATGVRFKPTRRNLSIAGATAGFTGTVAAIGGPPMALTYQHSDPRTLRSSLAVFNAIGSAFAIPSLIIAGVLGEREARLGALLIPGVMAGLWFGRWGVSRLPDRLVRPAVLVLCSASALALLAREISRLVG